MSNINKLLKERYFLEDETCWEDIAKRVSAIYPPIFDDIKEMRFIPSSPTLMNANTNGKRKGTLSSCFTMGIEDSIEGIFDSLKEGALVTKAGGGVGYNFSNLRSSSDKIKSLNRNSSGPLPFMKIFNSMLDGIQQGGVRRGAGMGMLNCDHKNILDFIRTKNTKGELERLNLSVRMTDEFYTKLKETPDFPHIVRDSDGNTTPLMDNDKVVTVKKLWDEIIDYAWKCAEPGLINIDIASERCTIKHEINQLLTNPCFKGSTLIHTIQYGDICIKDLVGKEATVYDGEEYVTCNNFRVTGKNQYVDEIQLQDNTSIFATSNHKFILSNGNSVLCKNLVAGDVLFHANTSERRATITNIIRDSSLESEVYCCTIPSTNKILLSNGILIGQCSEFINVEYSSCNLGSINLTSCVKDKQFDWELFNSLIRKATRFLNNIIDMNDFPLEKIKDVTLDIRPIGLGVMGWAHALYMMEIPFNSDCANKLADQLFYFLTVISIQESIEIAKETGKSYPAFNFDRYVKANERFFTEGSQIYEDIKKFGVANSCNSSIAPTGTISFLTNTTGGIEPVFALTYARKIEKLNREYETVYISDPIFESYLNANFDEKIKEKILKQVSDHRGSCQKVKEIPENMRKVFVTATDLTPMEHLESLGHIAKHISLGISKTINLPSTATREEISNVYLKAHELGVIGVTVYRDGCRDGILVHNVDKENKEKIVKTNAPKRPKKLPCHVYRSNILNRITNESEQWIIFIGLLDDEPYEIMAGKINGTDFDHSITEGEMVKIKREGKNVYQFCHNDVVLCDDIQSAYMNGIREAFTRVMSWGLRHGAGIEYLKDVLSKSDGSVVDFSKAIQRAINKYVKESNLKERCPNCNEDLIFYEGCIKCKNPSCGYSKCG